MSLLPPLLRRGAGLFALLLSPSTAAAEAQAHAEAHAQAAESSESTSSPLDVPGFAAISAGYTRAFTPHSVSHDGLLTAAELRPHPSIAFGVTGVLYAPFDQSFNATPLLFPLTRTFGMLLADVKVFFLRGSASASAAAEDRRPLYEVFAFGGPGVLRQTPISVVDPDVRRFETSTSLTFNLGLGARYFVHRHVAITVETCATSYVAQHENRLVAPFGSGRDDPGTWLGDRPLSFLVSPQLGVTVIPF